ncbi:MAG: nitroreductase family protein [Candidatus Firestonebacteria bacterium]
MHLEQFPVYKAITERRTIRRFKQDKISDEILKKLVNAGRLAPSGANLQPIEYIIVNDEALVVEVFKNVKWAGYITPKGNPKEGEKPTAYIIVLVDRDNKGTTANYDVGAAVENVLLTSGEEEIGTCWMGSIDRENLRKIFNVPNDFIIDSVIALGYKGENPVVEEYKGSVKYWKDEGDILHIPKRNLKDILHWNKF